MVAHGASLVCKDRLFEQSDKFRIYVCATCELIAETPAPADALRSSIVTALHTEPYCRHCRSQANIYPVDIPYACKLFCQELMALHIVPKLTLAD